MVFSRIVRFDSYRTLAFGSISGTYAAVGTALEKPMRLLHFQNTSDVDLLISFDQVNDNLYLPAGSFALYDFNANQDPGADFKMQVGTQIYVKQASGAPGSGGIQVMAVYGMGE
jgi:hypothetical protein